MPRNSEGFDMAKIVLNVDDLMKRMSARIMNGTCEFVLRNSTPSNWRVRITEGGCKFFYSDGTSDIDGPKNLNLDSGDSYSFYSGDSTKCVKQCFLAITVNVPGEDDQTLTYTSEMAPDGECWLRNGVELGQKSAISEKDLSAKGISNRMEFYPIYPRR
jgi:hypothetical protein